MAWEICGLQIVWPQDEKILYTDKNDENKITVFHVWIIAWRLSLHY